MEKLRALLSDAQSSFARLSQRERRLVGLAGAALAGFIVFIILFSFSSSAATYKRRTQDKLQKLSEIQALAASYREAEQERQGVEQALTQSEVGLISLLEEKGTAAGVAIPTMNPKADVAIGDGKIIESAVELTLIDVQIDRLVDFLQGVEASPGVVMVKYLRLEPKPGQENLTAWVTIATYRLKK